MSLQPADDSLELSVAHVSEMAQVLDILNRAASWLTSRGIEQWPQAFTEAMVEPALRAGETWLARQGSDPVGTVTLSWTDGAWPEAVEDAGYVHRLAVRDRGAGLGERLLAWAGQRVAARGRSHLRLDCVATNEELRRYYERLRFSYCGDVELFGSPGQRLSEGTGTMVSRFELLVSEMRPAS
jgi:GNAT superfamily N-acetyltransferase